MDLEPYILKPFTLPADRTGTSILQLSVAGDTATTELQYLDEAVLSGWDTSNVIESNPTPSSKGLNDISLAPMSLALILVRVRSVPWASDLYVYIYIWHTVGICILVVLI